jgi:hypothetical protein
MHIYAYIYISQILQVFVRHQLDYACLDESLLLLDTAAAAAAGAAGAATAGAGGTVGPSGSARSIVSRYILTVLAEVLMSSSYIPANRETVEAVKSGVSSGGMLILASTGSYKGK